MQTITLPELIVPDHVTDTPLGKITVPGVTIDARMAVIEPELIKRMIDAARLATETAYNNFPAAIFPVGAAVIMADDGEAEIFTSTNAEMGVLNAGICAERALLHYVVSKGFRRIKYLVVTTPNRDKGDISLRSPCGLCRQTIAEFSDENTLIFIDNDTKGHLADVLDINRLLPYRYKLEL
jgi:cytidine deaminase